jgi:hypothetical protein
VLDTCPDKNLGFYLGVYFMLGNQMLPVFVVLIHPEAHAILLASFSAYLFERDTVHYFLSVSAPQFGVFLSLSVAKNGDNGDQPQTLDVQIPLSYVLAIVDMTKDKHPLGFLDKNT